MVTAALALLAALVVFWAAVEAASCPNSAPGTMLPIIAAVNTKESPRIVLSFRP
jgi:hypothetical protein